MRDAVQPAGGRSRSAGGLARLFSCFAPSPRSVVGEPAAASSSHDGRARSSKPRRGGAATAAAAAAVTVAAPPSPFATDPLAAYLGRQWLAPVPCTALEAASEASIAQTSSYATPSGSRSGGSLPPSDPYDADEDSDYEGSPGSAGARRFRPAVRHSRPGAEGAAAGEAAAAHEAAGVLEIVAAFESLSISSGGSSAAHGARGDDSSMASPVSASACAPGGVGSTCTAELHAAPRSQPPSRCGSSRSRSSSVSLAASGSVSLAHFLAAGSSSARSLGSSSLRSTARTVRRLGSVTQVVVPDSPVRCTAGRAASGGPAPEAGAAASSSSAGAVHSTLRGEQARSAGSAGGLAAGAAAAAAAGPAVHQRLSELQGYHFVSLERIRSQAGDFQGESASAGLD